MLSHLPGTVYITNYVAHIKHLGVENLTDDKVEKIKKLLEGIEIKIHIGIFATAVFCNEQ